MGGRRLQYAHALTILYTNACSIRNKWPELLAEIEQDNIKVLAITETWLSQQDQVPTIVLGNFDLYRQDREGSTIGGGVAILVNRDLSSLESNIKLSTQHVQVCAAILSGPSRRVSLVCIPQPQC